MATVDYLYDGLGHRVAKKLNGTTVKEWLYSPARSAGGHQFTFDTVVAELDGNGAMLRRFVYGTKAHVPDYMVVLSGAAAGTYRLITDQLGSVRLVVKASDGTVAQRIDYDVWGNVLTDTNESFQPFGFAGGLYDPDTGLIHFGLRDYDPETARWLSKDPLVFNGGDTNLYAYAHNDPVNRFDPEGTGDWLDAILNPGAFFSDPANIAGGLAIAATAGAAIFGNASIGFDWNAGDPVVVLRNSPAVFGNLGMTWGPVVALETDEKTDPATYAHELAHVKQHDIMGRMYLPAHAITKALCAFASSPSKCDPLESGPSSTPPCPFK